MPAKNSHWPSRAKCKDPSMRSGNWYPSGLDAFSRATGVTQRARTCLVSTGATKPPATGKSELLDGPSSANKVSPRTQMQKEAHDPGKVNKHKLAGQNEASAPSRLRGNYDISSIAVLVQHSSTHLPTGFREAWSSTTPTHASFYLCTDPEQPAMMLVVQPCARRNNPAVSATT